MFIGQYIIVIVEEWKTDLMSLAFLFHFLCTQHVSGINISIIRSLRLCYWITTSVVLYCKDGWFSVSVSLRCVVVCVWCQWKYAYQPQQSHKTHHTKHTTTHRKVTLMLKHPSLQNKTTDVVIHQHSRKLRKMDILMSETCWGHTKWNKIASDIKLAFHSSTIAMMHGPINIRL